MAYPHREWRAKEMMEPARYIGELKKAWRDENIAALTYIAAAEMEKDPARREIFEKMAAEERKHAGRWEARLHQLGAHPGGFRLTFSERIRLRNLLARGTGAVADAMEGAEKEAGGFYEALLSLAPTEEDRAAILETRNEESGHDKVLGEIGTAGPHPSGRLKGILGKERWHVRGGGWIGQAIYGVNDGLGAAFGIVSGVAGATHVNGSFVLLSGFVSMIASALSMGSGAYLASKSEREVHEAEMDKERKEIEENPEEEREELALFYQLKGFSKEEGSAMAARIAEKPEEMLKILAHEELGLSEQAFPNEWKSAASATVSTAIGAAIPVLPYLFTTGMTALIISFTIATAAHFAVGAAKVVVTGRSWLKSGLEMMLIGLGEAAITYGIGLLVAPLLG
jgi:VIT1/CCC1 family predicted Fe2+/Mn2+ transporter/rubrerythrin